MRVQIRGRSRQARTVQFDPRSNKVVLIDQRRLPHELVFLRTLDYRHTALAITEMAVRGAGAIAATAAYGLVQGIRSSRARTLSALKRDALKVFSRLAGARPTAVDPVNVMKQMLAALESSSSTASYQITSLELAEAFANEQVEHCRQIGIHGAPLISKVQNILTHCNAGWLAFVDVGTATAPLYEAHRNGHRFFVYCDETRPRCQGASLTAWELGQQGISHAVIADNAAGHLMQRGRIDLVIVGSDRVVAQTGEVVNKIGTYTKAVLAHRHHIPFYVAIPCSTIDWHSKSGEDIPIEERDPSEVLCAWGWRPGGGSTRIRIAAPGSNAINPAFDVTPAELVTGIITPAGIFKPSEIWKKRKILGYSNAG